MEGNVEEKWSEDHTQEEDEERKTNDWSERQDGNQETRRA
jgi:hypothetical protein